MLKKSASLLALFILLAWLNPAAAAKPNFAPEFPDRDGTYDVPGNDKLKVRIFVHKEKPGKFKKPAPAVCTDLPSDSPVGKTGWHMEGDWTYKVNPAGPSSLGSNIPDIVTAAKEEWMGLPELNSAITFQNGDATSANRAVYDGQNIIAWGRTSGNVLGVTYTWYYRDTGVAVESDTIMNQKFPWGWKVCTSSAYDAQDILTHELGHWFGLNDHYTASYKENTMYGYGSKGEIKKNTLTNGDIAGVASIY